MKAEILLILTIATIFASGEVCTKNDKSGICKPLSDCKTALDDFRKYKRRPQMCKGNDGKVCCVERVKSYSHDSNTPLGTMPPPDQSPCEPIARNLTAERTGRKSWDKCLEYQEKLIYPCRVSNTPLGGKIRLDFCNRKPDSLIIGGEDAYEGEFPHMVLLGFGNVTSESSWGCGGVLVSERFILTAGHCISSKEFGPVTDAKVGILERSAEVDSTRRYKIKRIIKHPDYQAPSKYNDIALLETDREITLDNLAVPACLYDGHPINDSSAIVTGWGTTVFRYNKISNILQKVTLQKFSDEDCSRTYAPNSRGMRHMKKGYNSTTQMCFGDWHKKKDSCNGDSGGPAQIKHPQIYCMYSVVGITSWGRECGHPGQPAIYTRVAGFIPWIESIVWP
ncbi:PREDICTED: trypsin-1-like [Papilio xuthus]|uniref:Trypsin-1-like n=1 Tax=Papilio xuthus TaxID=66420 RepID=A0AAJ6Z6B0_PAPXU|nr:PREDICTED: trypsin-1-like [Papilio xuthus]